jgi:integrase/recombinase XerD
MLEEFKRDLIGKNRAKNTLKIIDLTLVAAQDHFKKPLETLTIEDLKKYFEGLKKIGRSVNTIELHQQKFIQFYKWCLDETDNDIYATLSRKLKRIKVNRVRTLISPNEILYPEEIKKLINVATIERDRCLVSVLFESGMRIGELRALTVDMVEMNENNQEVIFHIPNIEGCKTGARSVLCLEVFGYVRDWLKCNPTNKFMPISESGLRHITERLFGLAGIKKPFNIHHFRHSSITNACIMKMQPNQISMRYWGITNSNMLQIYLHLSEQIVNSGYRDAKGLGNGNGNTVINPLSVRCVVCGNLIQSGNLCIKCKDSKELKEENSELKEKNKAMEARLDEQDKKMEAFFKLMQAEKKV